MKMINKAITKRRVKPVVQPIPAELAALPWNPEGAVVSAESIVFVGQLEWRDESWTEVASLTERVAR